MVPHHHEGLSCGHGETVGMVRTTGAGVLGAAPALHLILDKLFLPSVLQTHYLSNEKRVFLFFFQPLHSEIQEAVLGGDTRRLKSTEMHS